MTAATQTTEQNHKTKLVNKMEPVPNFVAVNTTSKVRGEFVSLVRLEASLQWVEDFILILTLRLLVLGFVLSMVDLLTYGSSLNVPVIIYGWAIVQALALNATLPAMWRRAFTRFDEQRYLAGAFLLVIGIGLALGVFATLSLQFLQQSANLSLDQVMGKLGLSPELLTYVRCGSIVLMAVTLSVLNRAKVSSSQRGLSQLKNSTPNTEQKQSLLTEAPEASKNEQNTEPVQASVNTTGKLAAANKTLHGGGATNAGLSKQERVRAILQQEPDTTVATLIQTVGVSKADAIQLRTKFLEERGMI